ncbi:MAG: hypothetical protein AB1342_12100 [Pseudomonadota bacterium]
MTPRRFAIGLMIAAAALFMGTALANVLIDPEAVFGTELFPRRHPNYRYLGVRDYQKNASQVDALFFSSSRGYSIDQAQLAKAMGATRLHDQAVPYGLISDHLPVLEYILRDKDKRGEKIKSVFLMLDTDLLGKPAWTNVNIDCFLPPEVTGGSKVRFWWRYLTAVQFLTWRDGIKGALSGEKNPDPKFISFTSLEQGTGSRERQANSLPRVAPPSLGALFVSEAHARIASLLSDEPGEQFRKYWITSRPDIDRQLALIYLFVELCREHGIKLTVATTPLQRANINLYRPGELDAIAARINRITEIWDFASPGPITDKAGVWLDYAHFRPEIGAMMIARIFGGDTPVPPGFGQLKPQTRE